MSENVSTEKNLDAALALAAAGKPADVAQQFGVSRRTVDRWLSEPAFRRIVWDLRQQMVAAAVGRMADHMTLAADALVKLLDSDDAAVRLRACRAILSLGLRLHDAVDLEERLRALEDEAARRSQGLP